MPPEKHSNSFWQNYYVVDVHDNHGNDDTYGINDNGADVEDNVHAHGDFDTDAKVDDCDDKLWRWCWGCWWSVLRVMLRTMLTMMQATVWIKCGDNHEDDHVDEDEVWPAVMMSMVMVMVLMLLMMLMLMMGDVGVVSWCWCWWWGSQFSGCVGGVAFVDVHLSALLVSMPTGLSWRIECNPFRPYALGYVLLQCVLLQCVLCRLRIRLRIRFAFGQMQFVARDSRGCGLLC